jgi:maleylacetoacetate isomerase
MLVFEKSDIEIIMQLYTFAQSSASYRVRIGLALKGLKAESIPISLLDNSHQSDEYKAINPQGRVPYLVDGEVRLSQSFAILDYLEETQPNPSLYPIGAYARAKCRAFAHVIATDIFPLQNLSTRRKLAADFGADESVQAQWSAFWIAKGFAALEEELSRENKSVENGFLFADYPTLADICLVPQMRNARRYAVDLSLYPRLVAFDAKASAHEAFVATAPETQVG